MFLSDREIKEWARNGGIYPYVEDHVNPASIDLTLGREWRDLEFPDITNSSDRVIIYSPLDVSILSKYNSLKSMPTAILAITEEWVEIPDNMVGMIKLKSTPSRLGLAHPIADWVDPGYKGKLTLMLNAVKTLTLPVGIRVVQLTLCKLSGSVERSYAQTGHYNYQTSPTIARSDYA